MASRYLFLLSLRAVKSSNRTASPFSVQRLSVTTPVRKNHLHPRPFSSTSRSLEKDASSSTSFTASKIYQFPDISTFSSHPSPSRILIDVREPSELASTGTIPTSRNIPLKSSADAFFLPAEEFEDRFGFPKPGGDVEVIFFCKSGVRSKAAAVLARQAGFGGEVGEYEGSWGDWSERGGKVEKVGEK